MWPFIEQSIHVSIFQRLHGNIGIEKVFQWHFSQDCWLSDGFEFTAHRRHLLVIGRCRFGQIFRIFRQLLLEMLAFLQRIPRRFDAPIHRRLIQSEIVMFSPWRSSFYNNRIINCQLLIPHRKRIWKYVCNRTIFFLDFFSWFFKFVQKQ